MRLFIALSFELCQGSINNNIFIPRSNQMELYEEETGGIDPGKLVENSLRTYCYYDLIIKLGTSLPKYPNLFLRNFLWFRVFY